METVGAGGAAIAPPRLAPVSGVLSQVTIAHHSFISSHPFIHIIRIVSAYNNGGQYDGQRHRRRRRRRLDNKYIIN